MYNELLFGGLITRGLEHLTALFLAGMCIYLGYRLFYIDKTRDSDLEAKVPWGSLRLMRAAPGTFFTLFGCAIVIMELQRGIQLRDDLQAPAPSRSGIAADYQAIEPGKLSLDMKKCARATDFALKQVKLLPSTDAESKQRLVDKEQDLEELLAFCVDAEFGMSSYGKYKNVRDQMEKGTPVDASEDFREAWRKVSAMLAP